MLKVVFISGMSGAGKTTAQNTLEDMGYMCIDNMPPTFIPQVVELINKKGDDKQSKIGFIFDVKYHSVKQIVHAYNELKLNKVDGQYEIDLVFLDASDDMLLGRYRETRRTHPLASKNNTLAEGIKKERQLMQTIRENADVIVDTTELSAKELASRLTTLFSEANSLGVFNVMFMSFGFKHGLPVDADFVLDVRFLPNPFYDEKMRVETGMDQDVIDFVLASDGADELLTRTIDYLEYLLANYKLNNRNNFVVALGCTGGQHRSVVLTTALYNHFKTKYTCFTQHRDMEKNQLEILNR